MNRRGWAAKQRIFAIFIRHFSLLIMIGSTNVASSARNIFNLVVSLRAYPDILRVVGA